MRGIRVDQPVLGAAGAVTDQPIGGTLPGRDPTDVIFAREALDRRRLADADRLLRRALDAESESTEVRTLMGVLHERLGEHHAAYQCYKKALKGDHHNLIARAGLRRYCDRFGFDFNHPAINPLVDDCNDPIERRDSLRTTVATFRVVLSRAALPAFRRRRVGPGDRS
jgi:tetratricopeptide (TPR) repeat protein